MSQKKLPSFQFYPGDWMKDPNLRRCSKAGVGMAIDMLCLMFECKERGVLSSAAGPWPDREIAAAVGGDISENLMLLDELLTKEVFSRNTSGAVFSRRMVRDEHLRQVRASAGKSGGTTTAVLLKQKSKQTGSKRAAKSGSSSSPSSSPSGADAGASGARASPVAATHGSARYKTTAAKPKRPGKRKRTDAELAMFQQIKAWWCEVCWPRFNEGHVYEFDLPDAVARGLNYESLWRFLDHNAIGQNLDRAQQTMEFFTRMCVDYSWRFACPLARLAKRADEFWRKSTTFRSTYAIGVANNGSTINAARPDEIDSDLPVGVRSYEDDAGTSRGVAAAG